MSCDWFIDPVLVVVESFRTYLQLEVGEFCENDIMQIITLQCKTLGIIQCLVDKLAFPFVNYIVVANQLLVTLCFGHLVWLVGNTTVHVCVTDANEAFLYKVHLVHFLVLVIYYVVINIVKKTAWKEALGDLE